MIVEETRELSKRYLQDVKLEKVIDLVFGFEGIKTFIALRSNDIFLDSSMVEHSAVNRVVVGSSPTRGVSN